MCRVEYTLGLPSHNEATRGRGTTRRSGRPEVVRQRATARKGELGEQGIEQHNKQRTGYSDTFRREIKCVRLSLEARMI